MKKIYGILCIMLCFFGVGCSDDSNDNAGLGLDVVERNMSLTAAGGNATVTLSIDGEEVISDQDWCTPTVSGKIVTITLGINPDLEGRTALVTVKNGAEAISFPITQPGNEVPVASIKNVSFDAKGGTQQVNVSSILPVTAVSKAAWLSAKMEGNVLILTAQTNYTNNALTTTVTLSSGNLDSEITITQTGIVLVPEKTAVTMYNEGDEVKVKVNSTLAFKAVSDKEWLTITPGDDFVTLTAADNSGQPTRDATVTLTSESLTATINITQRPPIYSDYLGNWTLTGLNNGAPFTYDISVVQATANSTYKVTGWGKSTLATDSKYAIQANFHSGTGMIFITAQEKLGVFTNGGTQYDVMFYGQTEFEGKLYYVPGAGYIVYIGVMQRDGSVQWMNGEVEYSDGTTEEIVGARYFIKSKVNGSVAGFNDDSPIMREPVMKKKVVATTAVRNIINDGWGSITPEKGINTPWRSYAKENGYRSLLKTQ